MKKEETKKEEGKFLSLSEETKKRGKNQHIAIARCHLIQSGCDSAPPGKKKMDISTLCRSPIGSGQLISFSVG